MKPGDEILIRAKLISVQQSDNEVTVGFDSTTTAVVPLGAVGAHVSLEAVSKLVPEWEQRDKNYPAGDWGEAAAELEAALAAEGQGAPASSGDAAKVWDYICPKHRFPIPENVPCQYCELEKLRAAAPSLHKEPPTAPCCEHMPVEHFVAPDGWIVCNRCTCVRKPAALHKEGAGGEPGLREALEAVQWAGTDGVEMECPYCFRAQRQGVHTRECIVGRALAATDAPKETPK